MTTPSPMPPTRRRRRGSLVLAATAALALLPAAANAATVGRAGGHLDQYQPGNTELLYMGSGASGQMTILAVGGGNYRFHDPQETITPTDDSCHVDDAHTVTCVSYVGGPSAVVDSIHAYAGAGNDSIDAEVGVPVLLDGGEGNDSLRGGSVDDKLYGGAGEDDLHGDGGQDLLDAGAGADTLLGGDGNDQLDGGTENDTLDGGAGADVMHGGTGDSDVADYSGRQKGVTVDLDGADGDDGAAGENDTVELDVEDVRGGNGPDTLTGNAFVNYMWGGAGNDTINGGDNHDSIDGGAGDDTLNGDAGGDTLNGGIGDDALKGGADDDSLDGGTGADDIDGGAGTDYLVYAGRTAPLNVSLDDVGNDGAAGELDNVHTSVESVTGGTGDDTLTGDGADNLLDGGPGTGKDTLDGKGGKDYLAAGAGDDVLRSRDGAATDTDSCRAGTDTVQADAGDKLIECESVDTGPKAPSGGGTGTGKGTGSGGGSGTPSTPGGKTTGTPSQRRVTAAGPRLRIGPGRITIRHGQARVRLTCPATARGRCHGTLRLTRGRKAIGRRTFSVAAGHTATVRVTVARVARTAAGRHPRGLKVVARATARAGRSRARVSHRTIRLTLARTR